MKAQTVASIPVLAVMVFAFIAVMFVPGIVKATTTTTTIPGWLVPDSAHFANSLIVTFFPLAGLVTMTTAAKFFKLKGDIGVYLALTGLALGATAGMLSVSNGTSPTSIPFATTFVSWLLLFLYWWNS